MGSEYNSFDISTSVVCVHAPGALTRGGILVDGGLLQPIVALKNEIYQLLVTIMEETQDEIVMLPLSEILSIRWTEERRKRLKELREDTNLTLTELTKKLDLEGISVSRQYLHRLESDAEVKGVSPKLVGGLCKALGVQFAELLCLESQKIVQLGMQKRN